MSSRTKPRAASRREGRASAAARRLAEDAALPHRGDQDLLRFFRGIRTRAVETKTRARFWVCSSLAAERGCEGWLATTLRLLEEAHGERRFPDDHLSKKAHPYRKSWDLSPPEGAADTAQMRALMLEALPDGRHRLARGGLELPHPRLQGDPRFGGRPHAADAGFGGQHHWHSPPGRLERSLGAMRPSGSPCPGDDQEDSIKFRRGSGKVRPLDTHPLLEAGLPASPRARLMMWAPRIWLELAADDSPTDVDDTPVSEGEASPSQPSTSAASRRSQIL